MITRSTSLGRAGAAGVGGLLLGLVSHGTLVGPTPVTQPAPVVVTLDPPEPTGPPLIVQAPAPSPELDPPAILPAAPPGPDWRHWYDPTEGRVRPVWGTLDPGGTVRFDPMDRMNDHLTAYRR